MAALTYTEPKPKTIAGAKGDWELVIGLEVHAQVASKAKLFSGASTKFGAEPNSNVSFVDAAMPGMLPVINAFCVEQAVRTGLGLKADINLYSAFDRKNYFYPDLPQGYQISQLYHPIVGEGEVLVDMEPGITRKVRVERIHLEQDAGKSVHDMDPNMSFVDLNRTGVALMEIVSRPDIRGPEEAAAYVAKIRQILRYLGTCDGNMQNGNLRADVNVSVCKAGDYEKFRETGDFNVLGTRCEIKNMNSMRFIQAAIDAVPDGTVLILDEAYVEFAAKGIAAPFDINDPRVIRMRTFSKAYGLAGVRVGYAIGHAGLIKSFDKIRNHFGLSRSGQIGAMAAFQDQAYLAQTVANVAAARERISKIALANGLQPIQSATNFVTIDCGRDADFAKAVVDDFSSRGIFIRRPFVAPFTRCIRVSAGRVQDLDMFEAALPLALKACG